MVGGENGVTKWLKKKKVTLEHVYKLKGMTQKKNVCDARDLKKVRVPKKTKMMNFTAKVEGFSLDGWDMSPTLTGLKVEYSNHYIICEAQSKTYCLLLRISSPSEEH